MTALELLAHLNTRRVVVVAEGGRLRWRAPQGAMTPELLDALATHRAELLSLLGRIPEPYNHGRARQLIHETLDHVSAAYPPDFGLAQQAEPWSTLDAAIDDARQQRDMPAMREALQSYEQTALKLFKRWRREQARGKPTVDPWPDGPEVIASRKDQVHE